MAIDQCIVVATKRTDDGRTEVRLTNLNSERYEDVSRDIVDIRYSAELQRTYVYGVIYKYGGVFIHNRRRSDRQLFFCLPCKFSCCPRVKRIIFFLSSRQTRLL